MSKSDWSEVVQIMTNDDVEQMENILLKLPHDWNYYRNWDGYSILDCAVLYNAIKIVYYLIDAKGLNSNHSNSTGRTTMHVAAREVSSVIGIKIFIKLFNNKGDLSIKCKNNMTPIDVFNKLIGRDLVLYGFVQVNFIGKFYFDLIGKLYADDAEEFYEFVKTDAISALYGGKQALYDRVREILEHEQEEIKERQDILRARLSDVQSQLPYAQESAGTPGSRAARKIVDSKLLQQQQEDLVKELRSISDLLKKQQELGFKKLDELSQDLGIPQEARALESMEAQAIAEEGLSCAVSQLELHDVDGHILPDALMHRAVVNMHSLSGIEDFMRAFVDGANPNKKGPDGKTPKDKFRKSVAYNLIPYVLAGVNLNSTEYLPDYVDSVRLFARTRSVSDLYGGCEVLCDKVGQNLDFMKDEFRERIKLIAGRECESRVRYYQLDDPAREPVFQVEYNCYRMVQELIKMESLKHPLEWKNDLIDERELIGGLGLVSAKLRNVISTAYCEYRMYLGQNIN